MFAFSANKKNKYMYLQAKGKYMEIIFKEEYLQIMYVTGKTDKKHRYQPQIIRKYIRVIDLMAENPQMF